MLWVMLSDKLFKSSYFVDKFLTKSLLWREKFVADTTDLCLIDVSSVTDDFDHILLD